MRVRRVVPLALILSFVSLFAFSISAAAPVPLLGDGCYHIPTTSALVRVLVGAREVQGGLIADLTSGELWVLRAILDLEVRELSDDPPHDACVL
jgi:hypothetical protein